MLPHQLLDALSARVRRTAGEVAAGAIPDGRGPIKRAPPRSAGALPGFPEKIEGLAFGPDLADGRRLLIVTTDNDLSADTESWIWAFAIETRLLASLPSAARDAR